jgi:hypothetical protein
VSTLALAGLAAAGYASSLWVGGVTFAVCAGAAGLALFVRAAPGQRGPFLIALALAAVVALALVFPLALEQFRAAAGRGDTTPVLVAPFPVLGPLFPQELRGVLDVPAFWLILLAVEFPFAWLLSLFAVVPMRKMANASLSASAVASLGAGSLLVSNVGENNDLGWRAVLPAVIILTAFAAAFVAESLARRRTAIVAAAVMLLLLALPDGFSTLQNNAVGSLSRDAARFRDAPGLWAAVREQTGGNERIASNPRMTPDLAPWPVSLSWALLADRRSCFAGDELVLVFSRQPPAARRAASALFDRVFAGTATDADLAALVHDYHCRVFVLTPEDGAWVRDPFAANALFRSVAAADGKWHIYRAVP